MKLLINSGLCIMLNRFLLRSIVMLLAGGIFFTVRAKAQIVYVDSANIVGIHDGTSWATAFNDFDSAVTIAIPGDTIWVAKGSYQPATNTSFSMKNDVVIYGGFKGTETLVTQRNWITNLTQLTGNSTSVVVNNLITSSAVLDGFTITGGNTAAAGTGGGMTNNMSSPTLTNIIFLNNLASSVNGGGMCNTSSSPILTNVIFSDNMAFTGGGIYNISSSPSLTNVAFINNVSTTYGGGILNDVSSSPVITNVTFSGNMAISGGGIYNKSSAAPIITNCIFWSNTAPFGSDIFNSSAIPVITYSFTQTPVYGTGNITGLTDPFVNDASPAGTDEMLMTADDGLQLTGCSPAINTGNTLTNTTITDITTQPRIFNTTIDMGAYEYQSFHDGSSLAINNDTSALIIYPGLNSLIATGTCRTIGELLPNGSHPVTDSVVSKIWIDSTVQVYLGQPYVQRHVDITPLTAATTSTAQVTLFATQAEFDAFNVVSTVKLPTASGDITDISNLSIIQFHGTSVTGIPGSYSGAANIITPSNVTWNNSLNRWEITLEVNGFSGFIITATGSILSLNLLSFTGTLVNGNAQLQWQTANELNTDHFEIDNGIDGIHFDSLTTVKAIGTGNNSYATIDEQTQPGDNYYRLKSVDKDGTFAYSNIVSISKLVDQQMSSLLIYPNPTNDQLFFEYNKTGNAILIVYNLAGQPVLTTSTHGQFKTIIDISHLTAGTYILEYNSAIETLRNKFVKTN
jgi:hypothetical protein